MKSFYLTLVLSLGLLLQGSGQVLSDFEGGTTDGWTAEGDGVYYWESTPGNPGGCMRVDDDATGDMNRAYAPLKFLGNWSSATTNDTLKADIFLHPVGTSYVGTNFVFRIIGPGGQATGILAPTPPFDAWTRYKISLSPSDWQMNSGTWTGLLENVTTLIVTMEYISGDEYNRLDNVRLSFTPIQIPLLPVICSGFEDGTYEGWTFQGTGGVSNQSSGGDPGRYIRISNATPTAYAFAPSKFLGDWTLLNNHVAELRFDLLITTTGTLLLSDEFIRISGPGGVARIPMNNGLQNAFGQWYSFAFPIMESAWTIESGTWSQLISQVTELRLCLEFSAGTETVGLDDFCITNLPPQADFSADFTVTFVGNPVHFNDRSESVPTSWSWNFGDSGSSTEQNPVHTYTQPGSYNVTMTATNYYGADTELKTSYIQVIAIDECQKFTDDFNTTPVNPAWTFANGTWAISSGAMAQSSNYYGTSAIDGCYAITGSLVWSDYYISADMRSTDNDRLGLVFNFQDYQNMYMFYWHLQTPVRVLYKWVNGVETVLAFDSTGYAINTTYQVKVGGYNGYLTLTIDGQEIFSVADNTFTSGKAGLYCWGNQSSFWDNVLIKCAVPDTLEVEDKIIPDGLSECFEATQVITVGGNGSSFIVQNGGSALLVAGEKIRMLDGTGVLPGGYLHGYISPDGFYCHGPSDPMKAKGEALTADNPFRPDPAKRSGFFLYPNPTSGKFTIEPELAGDQDMLSIEVFNLLGVCVMKTYVPAEKHCQLDLSGQANGIYLVKAGTGRDIVVEKIVIQQ